MLVIKDQYNSAFGYGFDGSIALRIDLIARLSAILEANYMHKRYNSDINISAFGSSQIQSLIIQKHLLNISNGIAFRLTN